MQLPILLVTIQRRIFAHGLCQKVLTVALRPHVVQLALVVLVGPLELDVVLVKLKVRDNLAGISPLWQPLTLAIADSLAALAPGLTNLRLRQVDLW